MTSDVLISLGSNLGDRRGHLRSALKMIAALPRTRVLRTSSLRDTAPVGGGRQPAFINAVTQLGTRLSPMGLLAQLKRIEASRGRRPARLWGPRPLDLDILFYGGFRLRTPFLKLPHPRALEREFVLTPMAEILPGWTPPVRPRRTVEQWLFLSKMKDRT